MKKISILGSTGSIGVMALEVISHLKNYKVVGLSSNSNLSLLKKQILEYKPECVCIYDKDTADVFCKNEESLIRKLKLKVTTGVEGLVEIASMNELDLVLVSVVGAVGLKPIMAGIEAKNNIAIANKEPLVIAGKLLTDRAKEKGVKILPVDSEHSAIFQCLKDEDVNSVDRILVTASGGPFYKMNEEELKNVTVADALNHPRWKMGKKITVDSATLMNKGLEVIEAHHLFNIDFSKIEVLIHSESIIHSMVEYCDGSIMAHLGATDMRIPIQYALTYPKRKPSLVERLDFKRLKALHFDIPNTDKFPCLEMAQEAGRVGKTLPVVLNAANEIAVERFLNEDIAFQDIPKIISKVIDIHNIKDVKDIDEIIEIDSWAREIAKEINTK